MPNFVQALEDQIRGEKEGRSAGSFPLRWYRNPFTYVLFIIHDC